MNKFKIGDIVEFTGYIRRCLEKDEMFEYCQKKYSKYHGGRGIVLDAYQNTYSLHNIDELPFNAWFQEDELKLNKAIEY